MKILIVTENFKTGGLETQIMGFCRFLRNSGHKIHLISGIGSRVFPLREVIGDNILEVDMRPDISTKEAISSVNRIVSYMKEIEADILHLHPFTSILYGGIAASLTHKPYVVTLHGPLSLTYGYNATYRIFIDLILKDAWRVFCVSRETAERVRAIIPECNLKILPNGIDIERFKPAQIDPSGPVALVARLDSDKIPGIKSFLGEWAKLGGELRNPVHIFGEGNSFEEMKNWVKNILDGDSWITFMGHEDHIEERLRRGYSGLAGMGRVMLEAMAMELPAILVGYDGTKGIIRPDNVEEFAYRNFSGRYDPNIELGPPIEGRYFPTEERLRAYLERGGAQQCVMHMKQILSFVPELAEQDTICDIGCANGAGSKYLSENVKGTVLAFDLWNWPSGLLEYDVHTGLDLYNPSTFKLLPEGAAIILNHVIEHLEDPWEALGVLIGMKRPRMIIINVPCNEVIPEGAKPPEHLHSFNGSELRAWAIRSNAKDFRISLAPIQDIDKHNIVATLFFSEGSLDKLKFTRGAMKLYEDLKIARREKERPLLRRWVEENANEDRILHQYIEVIQNSKAGEYEWKEAVLSSMGEANDISLFGDKLLHCLLHNLPQNQSNSHWVNLYLTGKLNQAVAEKDNLWNQLKQVTSEKDNIWNQLNQTITKKNGLTDQLNQTTAEKDTISNQLNQTIAERDSLSGQLNQTLVERDSIWNQLNQIYSSDFWKVASWYYRVRNKSILVRSIYLALKWLRKNIKNNLYIKNIPRFITYTQRYGFRGALRRSYDKLKGRYKPFPNPYTYVKIELDNILRVKKDAKGIIVYLPTIDWNHTLFQRPHHIMLHFARKGFIAIFCTPNQIDALNDDLVSLEENLYLCKDIDALLDLSGRKDLILYISNTMHKPLIEKLRPAKIIYDYIDELEVFANYDSEMVIAHEELLTKADLMLTTAERLWEGVQHIRKDAVLCPNAVDYWHFAKSQLPGPVPFDFEQRGITSRPVIGYYGALAEWFDYDLLAKAAGQRPNYDFVLIGIDYDGSLYKSGVMSMPNVHYMGPKQYVELPMYLRYFDVAIIPFKLNKITHSTSPLKLFEYMSALKPIVATAMYEIKKYSCVLVAHDSDEFVNLLDKAITLKTDVVYLESMHQEALKNTWDRRVDTIIWWIIQPHFQQALIEYMNKKVSANHPMRDIYLEFASSTIERGDAVVKTIGNHTEIKGKRYLDVGCAYGGFPIAFARAGASEVIGVDIDSDLIGLAYELLKDYACPVQPKFIVCDILKCEGQDDLGNFDIITCNDVIEHVHSPEALVRRLFDLLNTGGIIYMEIPNAFNPNMVIRDGHYGLFGITLLDPANASFYYQHNFKDHPYDVGEYLDLDGYLNLFHSCGLEPTLLNEISEKEEELHQIARSIQSLPLTYKTAIKTVPASLRENMQEALNKYIDKFSSSYEQFLNRIGKVNAKQLYCYYGIEFWKFLLKKYEAKGNP